MGQVEEVKEDSKVFFDYLRESVAANYIFRDLIQEISRATWESKFDSSEKTTLLLILGQIEEDYSLIAEAVGTIALQEHHDEIRNLKIEAIRDLIIVAKGLKENWTYALIFERLDKLQRKLHGAITDFVVGLGHRIKDHNNGSAAQGSA